MKDYDAGGRLINLEECYVYIHILAFLVTPKYKLHRGRHFVQLLEALARPSFITSNGFSHLRSVQIYWRDSQVGVK